MYQYELSFFIYSTLYIENRQYDFPCKKAIGFPIAFGFVYQYKILILNAICLLCINSIC